MSPAPPESLLTLLAKIASWVVFALLIGAVLWRSLKKSNDPSELIFKWIGTALILVVLFWKVIPLVAQGGMAGAFAGIPATAVCGLFLAIIWRHSIAMVIAKPFGALYDGGDAAAEPEPFYSTAIAKRKRGHFAEAIADIRAELKKFPTDFGGQMLLAEIQAENLNDLPAAELTVQRVCQQPNHAPRNITYALNTLADWHLKYSLDPDAAREDLQQIITRLPETEFARLAEQRIAHLANREQLVAAHDRPRVPLPQGVTNIGLLTSSAHLAPAAVDQANRAAELVRQLEQHPHDTEAREQLAIIYADHFLRLDLAADQLTQLINHENQPAARVIRWLNLLADLQIRHGCTYDAIYQTLAQIIERYPTHGAAELASHRLDLLRLELKGKETPRTVKLGTYEQNIGLKYGRGGGAP